MSEFLPERILIIAIRAIGDVVLITPLFPILKKRFPDTSLAIVVDGPSAQVLENNPYLDHVFVIDRVASQEFSWLTRWKLWVQLVSDLRRYHFDIVIDLFSGPRSAILGYMARAKDRYGEDFRHKIRGFLYNHPIKICRDGRHLIEQKFDLIQPLIGKINLEKTALELHLTETERLQGKQLFGVIGNIHQKRIGFIPSAGSDWRVWPSERFAELADVLCETYGAEVILLGGEEDIFICRHIGELMHANFLDLSGKTTLRELIAVLATLDLVISNVTGPMHLAVALAQPKVIGLYGAADTVQYAPWGTHGTMLTKGVSQDAYWHKVDYQKDYGVLCQITVDDVLRTVKSVMTSW
ncbi:MAG: glycosyltransferase family 9 protein [Nitrospirae bacterium]|nr:glycosyltransferase family 9 protein [Nitrospirota bacterium]